MRLELSLEQYLDELKGTENLPLNLAKVLSPFRIAAPDHESTTLLMGHLFEALREDFASAPAIDIMDTLQLSCELGHAPADEFIELAPFLIFSSLRALTNPDTN